MNSASTKAEMFFNLSSSRGNFRILTREFPDFYYKDGFAPYEELLSYHEPGTHIHFSDFITDLDIIWVDSIDSLAWDKAVQSLTKAEIIGCDSEWRASFNKKVKQIVSKIGRAHV